MSVTISTRDVVSAGAKPNTIAQSPDRSEREGHDVGIDGGVEIDGAWRAAGRAEREERHQDRGERRDRRVRRGWPAPGSRQTAGAAAARGWRRAPAGPPVRHGGSRRAPAPGWRRWRRPPAGSTRPSPPACRSPAACRSARRRAIARSARPSARVVILGMGLLASSCDASTRVWAAASFTVTPGRRRPIVIIIAALRCSRRSGGNTCGCIMIGAKTSFTMLTTVPWNSASATPTMVSGWPLR